MPKKTSTNLTTAEKKRLLHEIHDFDDQIEPVSLEELEQIEAEFEDESISPEMMSRHKLQVASLLEEAKREKISLQSILKRAEELNIDRRQLATILRLGTDILLKLERRIITNIPHSLLVRLSIILEVEYNEVQRYFQQAVDQADIAASSDQAPTRSRTQTWEEAVTTSQMPDSDQEYWLSQS